MDRTAIGEKLANLRGTRSQKKVATDLGISQAALCMYEKGERNPKDDLKVKIAAYYKTSVAKIFYC